MRSPSVFGRLFALVSLVISLPFIELLLCREDIFLVLKLLLNFRNLLKHSEGRSSSLLVVKISNEAKHEHKSFMKASTQGVSDIRGRTGCQSFLSPTDLSEFYVDITVLCTKM